MANYWPSARKARRQAHDDLDAYIESIAALLIGGERIEICGTDADDLVLLQSAMRAVNARVIAIREEAKGELVMGSQL